MGFLDGKPAQGNNAAPQKPTNDIYDKGADKSSWLSDLILGPEKPKPSPSPPKSSPRWRTDPDAK